MTGGVGMPYQHYLEFYATLLFYAFGEVPYLVGSYTRKKKGNDVDVRIIMDDKKWAKSGLGDPARPSKKLMIINMAFSELGLRLTQLPIDFQIQQMSWANKCYKGKRWALGVFLLREK